MTCAQQMANIGSEVSRALNWRQKKEIIFSKNAAARALELIDLSLSSCRILARLKEFARLRESLADYFFGINEFSSSDILWRKYFDSFSFIARRGH
jgi:hypothetical protein